ncbi:kinase-like protein [Penicillium robsamsonii]|uniref:kinase-like protein n=1 Tax=Penicillium robsamsonii TaxID=1792511 RepID=UPI0025477B55|nr:kinase-like protein [Penicillium robsamsonii]KAJ5812927.1 kinase-like protein [Penicillium robsamsonii]
MSLPGDLQQASVIASCANPSPGNVVSQYGKRIIRISDHQIVKCGPDMTREEYENQRIAYGLVDSRIARIPRVYEFFLDERGWGYIVMEFIEGKIIDPLNDVGAIQRIASVLDHFTALRYKIPGSFYGGACRGLLFPETEDLVFDTLDQMEKWFNSRLFAHNPTLTLQGCELVLCHLDIAPRNMLWQEDGSLCLLDWASAGFYPRLFEFCMQWIFDGKDGSFNSLLLESMNPLSDHEMAQKDAILCAWRNIQKYPLYV